MVEPSLTPAQWARVSAEFPELEALPTATREARLAAIGVQHPREAEELRSLLAAADADGGLLERMTQDALADWQSTRESDALGRTIGPWRITRQIGRGGMGVVYEAIRSDSEFTQRVAIKTLAMAVHQPEMLWRFRRERRILADLSHPNITALIDGGATDDGVPYLVMEHLDGVRVDHWCAQQKLSLRARLDLFRTVCSAVQFAHGKLVVHRDLKPSNILVTRDGVVKLLDFGVAKLMAADDTDADTTRSGFAPLTTAYASPEQVRGEAISTATDVYALGVLLFRLLTGSAPYDLEGKSAGEVMQLLGETPPRLLSAVVSDTHAAQSLETNGDTLRRQLRGELDAIVQMALRKDPARRYATVQAFSDDVLRYLKGEAVAARPERWSYSVRVFVRRNRAFSVAVVLGTLSLMVGTIVSTWQARRASAESLRATRVRAMLESVLSASDPFSYNGIRAGSSEVPLRVVLDSAVRRVASELPDDPRTRADLYRSFASSYANLDELERARQLADSARTLHQLTTGPSSLDVTADIILAARVFRALGDDDHALDLLEQLRAPGAMSPVARDSLASLVHLGVAQVRQALFYEADSLRAPALAAIAEEMMRAVPRQFLIAIAESVLAVAETERGQIVLADSLLASAQRRLSVDSLRYPATPLFVNAYAGFGFYMRGALPASEASWQRARETSTRVFGALHPLTAETQSGLSWTLLGLGRFAEGKALADSALATELARTHHNAGMRSGLYRQQMSYALAMGDLAGAEAVRERALAELPGTGRRRPFIDMYLSFTSAALAMQQRDTTAAWQAMANAAQVMRVGAGASHPLTQLAGARLAEFSALMGRDVTTGRRLRGP